MAHIVEEINTPMSAEDFLEQFRIINGDEAALQAHRDWEKIDAKWKDLIKNRASRSEIMKAATGVRTAREYKDILHDEVARRALALAKSYNALEDYDADILGDATSIGDVQELSREWHDLRRKGVGGSSLSEAIGFHWKSMPGRPVWMDDHEMDEHWANMAVEKSTPPAEPEPITSGVLYRGHVWEPALLGYYIAVTDARVGVSKATWQGHRDIQVVNVDGIILDDDGNPEGIAECKTSSREWTWDNGVPVHYRAQVLWYLDATGLDYADVIVRFDSGKIDIHRIKAGETVDGSNQSLPVTGYLRDINRRWKKLLRSMKDTTSLWWDYPEKLVKERQGLDSADIFTFDEGFITDIHDILDSSVTVKITVLRPYERMDTSYDIPYHLSTSTGVDSPIAGVSPSYYPTSPGYSPDSGMSMDEVDDEISDVEWVVAVDEDTYNMLVYLYGDDGIIHASALRRMVEELPGTPDFSTVEETVEWMNNVAYMEENQ